MTNEPDSVIPRTRPSISHECIDLHALSGRQQRLVEHHMPLVSLTLRRYLRHCGRGGDLFQDGFLALTRAIHTHEPGRHGDFAPYAMARIRFAMNRSMHEDALVRVPYSTQRRHKARHRREANPDSP